VVFAGECDFSQVGCVRRVLLVLSAAEALRRNAPLSAHQTGALRFANALYAYYACTRSRGALHWWLLVMRKIKPGSRAVTQDFQAY